MVRVHFILIAEGSSDDALLPHLEKLCIDQGATEVTGTAPDFGRLATAVGHSVQAKLTAAMDLEPGANLVFIHRDADGRDPQPRYDEIAVAAAAIRLNKPYVAVVPVQATEAWLLVDEGAIRAAAYRANGTRPIRVPRPQDIERRARPKEVLRTALAAASELTGRRLERFKNDFPRQRRMLLFRLPIGGPLEYLPSWRKLRTDIRAAIEALRRL